MKKIDTSKLNTEQLKVFNLINNAENGITMKEIIHTLGQPESYKRHVSDMIHYMIVNHGIPVGSSSNSRAHKFGYFIIRDNAAMSLSLKTLTGRVDGINSRVEALKKIKRQNEKGTI